MVNMKCPFAALLPYLILACLVHVSVQSANANVNCVVQSSVVSGKTIVQTFDPTTYPGFATLNSTIQMTTSITVVNGISTSVQIYTHDVGPGGVGWAAPTVVGGMPVLAEPSYLPGQSASSVMKSSVTTSSTVQAPAQSRTTDSSFSIVSSISSVSVLISSSSFSSSPSVSDESSSATNITPGVSPVRVTSSQSTPLGLSSSIVLISSQVSLSGSTFSSSVIVTSLVSSTGKFSTSLSSIASAVPSSPSNTITTPTQNVSPTGPDSSGPLSSSTLPLSLTLLSSSVSASSVTTATPTPSPATSGSSNLLSVTSDGLSTGGSSDSKSTALGGSHTQSISHNSSSIISGSFTGGTTDVNPDSSGVTSGNLPSSSNQASNISGGSSTGALSGSVKGTLSVSSQASSGPQSSFTAATSHDPLDSSSGVLPSSPIISSIGNGNASVGTASSTTSTTIGVSIILPSETVSPSSGVGVSVNGPSETVSPSSGVGGTPSNFDVLTGTITSAPPGFTGITLSETTFTKNAWYTTTDQDHHTTLLPLIIGDGGHGILFWDFPWIPDIEFKIPGFPSFHLPCIKIFGISIGACTKPPAREDGRGNTNDDEDPPKSKSSHSKDDSTSTSTPSTSKSSSSEDCTQSHTVSNCDVRCVATTSSSCGSYTTECSQTNTGCSVTGTTSTITSPDACLATPAPNYAQATQTFCDVGCIPTSPPGSQIPPFTTSASPTSDSDLMERFIAGRITAAPWPLQKRGFAQTVTSLGGTGIRAECSLSTPLNQPLTIPAWPFPNSELLTPDLNGQMDPKFSVISRYDRATTSGCIFTITRLNAAGFANAPAWADFQKRPRPNNNDLSLDHAYEKNWVKLFLNSIISASSAGTLTCAETNQYFFPASVHSSLICHHNVLQPILDALASNTNLNFIAMSQYLNGDAKGKFFSNFQDFYVNDPSYYIPQTLVGWRWESGSSAPLGLTYSAADTLSEMILRFQTTLYGVLEMKSADMQTFIDKTNNRIYGEFLELDRLLTENPSNVFGDLGAYNNKYPQGFAGAYKSFMTNTIEPQINHPPIYLKALWENLIWPDLETSKYLPGVNTDANGNSPGQYFDDWIQFYNLYAAHNSHYLIGGNAQTGGAYSWDYTFAFSWDVTNTKKRSVGILERQMGSCLGSQLSTGSPGSSTSSPISSSLQTQTSTEFSSLGSSTNIPISVSNPSLTATSSLTTPTTSDQTALSSSSQASVSDLSSTTISTSLNQTALSSSSQASVSNPPLTTIPATSAQPTPTPSPTGLRPEWEVTCNKDHSQPLQLIPFTLIDEEQFSLETACTADRFVDPVIDPQTFSAVINNKNITGSFEWSKDQTRCLQRTDDRLAVKDCQTWFLDAVTWCEPTNPEVQWGAKVIWNSIKGCVEVHLWATTPNS